jgi:ATP-binding cassette subfamily B protein
MRTNLNTLAWTSAAELVEALARRSGFEIDSAGPQSAAGDPDAACLSTGLESEPIQLYGDRLVEQLRAASPAAIRWNAAYIGLLACNGKKASLLAPDLSVQRIDLETLRAALSKDAEAPHEAEVDRLLDACGISASRRVRARQALLAERLRSKRVGFLWQLRCRPGSNFSRQVTRSGLAGRVATLCAAHVAECALWLLAWWMIGQSALNGRLDMGWLAAWALLLMTMIPFRMLTTWSQGVVGVGIGGLLKQRLLAGALQLEPEQIRREGAGQLLGRAMEAETVESLAITGGMASVIASFELVLACAVLSIGAGGAWHALLLMGWVAAAACVAWQYTRRRARWTGRRLEMTHDLVERMTGHRTRLAQLSPERWHEGEDEALDRYMEASSAMDRAGALLSAAVPRGWLLVGMVGLAPAFLSAGASSAAELAAGLGGVILAYQALGRLVGGVSQLAGAGISWRQVAPLFRAAAKVEQVGVASVSAVASGRTVMEAHDLTFRYSDRGEPVLRGVSLRVNRGDWLLLEGASGGGKSTLAALMAGLRQPESGLLLAGGLDRATLGAARWRKRVAAAPQYHENHILAGTLSFNLLMGRHWPPYAKDVAEAEAVCRELGLGDLLARMPAGIEQVVGETGWQLSQGERSRVFLARALLQGGDLITLDESFAALDPENLRQCLECVLKRAETVMVVAHP